MKKILSILMILSLLLVVVGCTPRVGETGRAIEYPEKFIREPPEAPLYEYPEKRPVIICYEYTAPSEIEYPKLIEQPREPIIEDKVCCYFDKREEKMIIPERDCKMKGGRIIDIRKCYEPREPIREPPIESKEICCQLEIEGRYINVIMPEMDCSMKEGKIIPMRNCY